MEYNRRILYTVSLNHFTNDGATTLMASLFPIMLGLFHLDYIQVGVLVAIGLLTNVMVQPLVGRFADRVSSEKLMMAGMSLVLVSMLFFAVALGFFEVLLITVLLRVGSSFFHPVGLSRVSRAFEPARVDSAVGFVVAFGNFGVFASFIIGGYVYSTFGWGWPFYVWAALTAATTLLTWAQLRATRVQLATGGPSSGRHHPAAAISITAPPVQRSESTACGLVAVSRATILLVFSSAVVSAGYAVFTSFGNLTLVGRGLDVASSNLGVALFAGTSIIGAFSLGRLRRSFSNAGLLATSTVIGILSYIAMAVVGSPVVDLPLFLVAGFSGSIAGTATLAMASDFVGVEVRGTFYGALFAAQTLGAAIVSALSGIATQSYGLGAPYAIMTLFSIPVVVWAASVRGKDGGSPPVRTVVSE